MYAAAGGASLASRQARKKQAAQNNKNKASNQQILREKLAAKAATTPTKSKQFHQLPASYLRAPHQHHRKLSAGYTTVPGYDQHHKSLLPISEQSSSSGHGHHHRHIHPHHPTSGHTPGQDPNAHPTYKPTGFREYDKLVRRQQLTRSATATLPLASQAQDGSSPPQTPTFCCPEHHHHHHHHHHHQQQQQQQNPPTSQQLSQPLHLQIPNDPIIITPATPQATPPGKLSLQLHHTTADEDGGCGRPLTPSPGLLERKCSVYRNRKLGDPCDERCFANYTTTSTTINHQQDDVYFGGFPNGTDGPQQTYVCKWDTEYYCCDAEHRQLGVCTCDHTECAQGRAAWLERGRRCSVQETPASCHRRWVKRNRIQDSSLGGSSDDEDLLGVLRGPSSFANAFLYVGLGTIAIGLVIAFVGTGEKGFKTVELRLIGPSLIGLGLFCCILRILFCICPSHCVSSSRRARNKKNAKIDADHRTSLLRGDSKRVSIARGPHIPTKQPQIYPKSIVKTKTYEGVEALRQIATTSLFLQNEQKVSSNRIVPIIKEPEKVEEPPLELKKMDPHKADTLSVIDIVSISDGEEDDDDDGDDARSHRHRPHQQQQHQSQAHSDTQVIDLTGEDEQSHSAESHHQRKDSKLRRQRTSLNQSQKPNGTATDTSSSLSPGGGAASPGLLMETSLMIIGATPVSSPTKPPQQSCTLTVPMANTAATPALPAGLAPSSKSAFGATSMAPSIHHNNGTAPPLLPGSLSPVPSTSYLPHHHHHSPLTPPPIHHASSSSSSSNYLLSPPPMAGGASGSSATSPVLTGPPPKHPHHHQDPLAHATSNTVATTASSLQSSSAVTTTKTEPELVLSPAKLGQ